MLSCVGFPDVPETVTDSPSALTVYLRLPILIGVAATAPMGRNVNVMLSATNRQKKGGRNVQEKVFPASRAIKKNPSPGKIRERVESGKLTA